MQSFHVHLQTGVSSTLLAIRKFFRLVVYFPTLSPHKMHLSTKLVYSFGFFSGSCYLKKESSRIRVIYDQPVKILQGFAV